MNAKVMSAKEAKNSFGKFLDTAQRHPVVVTKNGRHVAVLISYNELEESHILQKAVKADKEGYMGQEFSKEFVDNILNA